MFTGLREQTVMEHKRVKKIGVEIKIGDLFESAKIQESSSTFCWYLFEMPRRALHQRESSGVVWGPWLMDLRQDWPGGSAKHLR